MDEVYVVRHKVLVEGRSVRQVAQEMGIARNTVRRYVRGAPPGVRRAAARSRPVMDAVRARAEAILGEAPRWTGGKQRLTATRLHRMLVEEGQRVGETVVKAIVREWRRRRQEVFVPLVYKPGDLAQVDFFEVLVDIEGDRRKAFLFVMRLMHSGRDFAWLYPRQDQVCFLDGHARAFSHFGAVPHRLAYDNFKAAVARILVGSERVLSARFLALTTHYLFEASFARPYTGHDKGGVEARGKGIRWQELVPGPARTRGLCADAAGFGLHAATRAGAGGARAREALVKYILRPPMANEHLILRSDGLVRVPRRHHRRRHGSSVAAVSSGRRRAPAQAAHRARRGLTQARLGHVVPVRLAAPSIETDGRSRPRRIDDEKGQRDRLEERT
jgi:transposase